MGRCYEFGVSISDGCEQAMFVPPEGGRCVCIGCGAPCHGQFRGCSAIISKPGYVPAIAPKWARGPRPPATATRPIPDGDTTSAQAQAPAPTAVPAPKLEEFLPLIDAAIRREFAARDHELVEALARLGKALAQARLDLAAQQQAMTDLTRRIEALEQPPAKPEPAPAQPWPVLGARPDLGRSTG